MSKYQTINLLAMSTLSFIIMSIIIALAIQKMISIINCLKVFYASIFCIVLSFRFVFQIPDPKTPYVREAFFQKSSRKYSRPIILFVEWFVCKTCLYLFAFFIEEEKYHTLVCLKQIICKPKCLYLHS